MLLPEPGLAGDYHHLVSSHARQGCPPCALLWAGPRGTGAGSAAGRAPPDALPTELPGEKKKAPTQHYVYADESWATRGRMKQFGHAGRIPARSDLLFVNDGTNALDLYNP